MPDNIWAIIQARMGSRRLTGKSMMDICGKPMLGRVIDRVKMAIENIIVATPNVEIAEYAESQGVSGFIGSEDDVLDRYYQTAKAFTLDHIIRITADNPMIDPDIISMVVDFYLESDFDYVSNNLKLTYPMGLDVEVFSFTTLEKTWCFAKDDREHVTTYIKNHPEIFGLGNVENDTNLSHLRWTVDYQEDLDFVREIYSNLREDFTMNNVLEYIGGKIHERVR